MEELVIIKEYDPSWPDKFRLESVKIANALKMVVASIDHVGSTSVPRLAAKPVIDICIQSDNYPPEAQIIKALAALGYEHLGEAGVSGRHFFKKGSPREFHLHWCPVNGDVPKSQLKFKEVLLNRPDLALKYADIKRSLSLKYGIDRAEYVKAKEPIIQEILNA
jgi:GrpB-like predicted nucleotidyltransferase (UPF0157 family)